MEQKVQKAQIKTSKKWTQYDIKKEIVDALSQLEFYQPTLIQAESLSLSLDYTYKRLVLLIKAITGTGKTLCFLIPILNSLDMDLQTKIQKNVGQKVMLILLISQKYQPQAIIITNSQQLSIQIKDRFNQFIKILSPYYEQKYGFLPTVGLLDKNQKTYGHILIAVMQSFVNQMGKMDFSNLKWVVADEADNIYYYEKNFFQKFQSFKESTKIIICSATLHQQFINYIQGIYQNNKKIIQVIDLTQTLKIRNKQVSLDYVKHYYYFLQKGQKRQQTIINKIIVPLFKILEKQPHIIIFFNKIPELQIFKDKINQEKEMKDAGQIKNIKFNQIHSKIQSYQMRNKAIRQMRNNQINLLLSTDAISRGIDIRNISLILNSKAPVDKGGLDTTTYVHRVGRTGRHNDLGVSLTILDKSQQQGNIIKNIKLQHNLQIQQFPGIQKFAQEIKKVQQSKK